MDRNIFILWLQGWDKAPWLQNRVLESWQINNKGWNIELLDLKNLNDYVKDIDYIYDEKKKISPQAKSDIIRLSVLKNIGGVWADSTLLCMQPLGSWAYEAIERSGFWMYHGHGYGLDSRLGPASWFILSEKNNYNIRRWKKRCDLFWQKNNSTIDYFWMDGLFKELLKNDLVFKNNWLNTPFLYCEEKGSSHSLASYNFTMEKNSKLLKDIFKYKPPYVLKLGGDFQNIFPDINSKIFTQSNASFAIEMSKRNFIFKHNFSKPFKVNSPIKNKPFLLKLLKNYIKQFLKKIYALKQKYNN